MSGAQGIRCMVMRGGSSKGLYFVEADLPGDPDERDSLLLRIMGSPDARQIDGLGGAHPLTSKVAIVSPSVRAGADVDYLFLQLGVESAMVTDRQNCGNLLAGVAPFALERGLVSVAAEAASATVAIHMRNTDSLATATIAPRAGAPVYDGDTAISGVPGTAALVRLDFEDIAGSTAGALLPTGAVRDTVAGVDCTLVDNGMPVVVVRADALGVTGAESCAELEGDGALRARLEELRLAAGELMNLGDVTELSVPKLTLVSAPRAGGSLCTRTFIPHRCHDAIGVLGAVSVATAVLLAGSPAHEVLGPTDGGTIVLEHPTGSFEAAVELGEADGRPVVVRAGIVRTARKLMDGVAFPRPR